MLQVAQHFVSNDGASSTAELLGAAFDTLQADLEELALIGELLRESSDEQAAQFDPSRLWSSLAKELAALPEPSLGERIRRWLTPPRLLPIGAVAAAAFAWFVVSPPEQVPTPPVATAPHETKPLAAAPSTPAATPTIDNECIVDSVETDDAEVLVGSTAGDEAATVIWLLADSGMDGKNGSGPQEP